MKFKELLKLLAQHGYYLKRNSKHIILTNGVRTISVPHQKEVKSWTVNKIKKEAGI